MNISSLHIPETSDEMIKAYEEYYRDFYLEMVRMSNSNFNSYIQDYIKLLENLIKSSFTRNIPQNMIRAAIGIISLHVFGYDDFNCLIRLYDRLLPQQDPEYVKFTSWCSGTLIHHPGLEQVRYVRHLFTERIPGWAFAKGRRARHLAAAHLINNLSISAGSTVAVYFPILQSIIWQLVSHESIEVLKATASAVYNFGKAIITYSRSDFYEFMSFFFKLSTKLLWSFGDDLKIYISLLLFKQLVRFYPEYFVPRFFFFYSAIDDASNNKQPLVQIAAYSVIVNLSSVDSSNFEKFLADEIFDRTSDLIREFPEEVIDSLCLLIENIPYYMKSRIDDLINFCKILVSISHSPFHLLSLIFKNFKHTLIKEFVFDESFLINLINYPEISEDYYEFIVNASLIFIKTNSDVNEYFNPNQLSITQSRSTYNIREISHYQSNTDFYFNKESNKMISSSSINNNLSLLATSTTSNNNSNFSSCSNFETLIPDSFLQIADSFSTNLSNRLVDELKKNAADILKYSNTIPKINSSNSLISSEQYFKSDTNSLLALKILAELPPEVLTRESLPEIMQSLEAITESPNLLTREVVPKAIYNIGRICQHFITRSDLIDRLFNIALYDDCHDVRSSALKVLKDNIDSKYFASNENMKSFQVFINDDSVLVKKIALEILEKLTVYNPIGVASITRNALLDNFFIIRHIPGIRKRSRVARILPDLIHASAPTISAYSDGFMELVIDIFKEYQDTFSKRNKLSNFIEVTSYMQFLIGLVDALTILAPLDPKQVSYHSDFLIDFFCEILNPESNRMLILSTLDLLYVLFRAPASTINYRAKAPTILSSCSELLTTTDSRKERIALLKVIGAIGILEVHQKSIVVASPPPSIYEESLTRQFYHPGRDEERTNCDESWLIQENLQEEYINVFTTSALLDIFKDDSLKEFHVEAVQSLVNIFASLNSNSENNFSSNNNNKSYMTTSMLHQFDMFVVKFLEVLRSFSDENTNDYISEMNTYLPLFSSLIHYAQNNISPFLKDSIELIKEKFCPELADNFIQIILCLIDAVKDAFTPYASDTICLLIICLDNSKTNDPNLSRTVLKAFSLLGIYASDLLYLIVPQICDAVECEQTKPKVRYSAFQTLSTLMQSVDLFPYLGPIMRALSTGLFNDPNDSKTRRSAFDFLYITLKTQGSNFLKSAEPLIELIESKNMMTDELRQIIKDVKNDVYSNNYRPLLHMHSNNIDLTQEKSSNSILKDSSKDKKKNSRIRSESIRNNYQLQLQLQQLNHSYVFSEDAITMKALTPNLGREKYFEQWLFSFMLTVISNSPSNAIRACTTLATNYPNLANKLFCTAFFSCWKLLSDKGRSQITKSFSDLLTTSSTYDTVNYEIIKLLVFMDKVEMPLEIDMNSLLQISIRYGGDFAAYALHLANQQFDQNPDDLNLLSILIDLYSQLGSWPNAQGLWSKASIKFPSLNNSELLSKLRMWDQVKPIYQEKFERTKDIDSFVGLTQSLASLAMWSEIMEHYGYFNKLERHMKNLVAPYFAQAAIKLGKWDQLRYILKFSPEDSIICKIMSALNALHNREMKNVDRYINQGFSLMSSKPSAILADNKQIVHTETMLLCQELVEISEMKSWLLKDHSKEIEEVWLERLKTAPRDFDLWFRILTNRACFTKIKDPNLIKFFSLKSATLGTKLHINAFDSLFPFFEFHNAPDIVKVCYVVAHWNTGERARATEEMSKLISQFESCDLLNLCRYIYSNWMINQWNETYNSQGNIDSLKIAYENLRKIIFSFDDSDDDYSSGNSNSISLSSGPLSSPAIKNGSVLLSQTSSLTDSTSLSRTNSSSIKKKSSAMNFTYSRGKHMSESNLYHGYVLPSQMFSDLNSNSLVNPVKVIRKWADVNVALAGIEKENLTYVTNAIDSLTKCATLAPSFPDIVLLLNIFFENAEKYDVFTSTAHKCIEQLPPKMLLQASPQILVQLSHPSKAVSDFVHDIVTGLLEEHYHELIFAIIVLTKSPNFKRAEAANRIKNEFTQTHPREYIEVILIRKCLLKASVTWTESMSSIVAESIDFFMHNKFINMKESLESLIDLIRPERAKCLMDREFQKVHGEEIKKLQKLLKEFPSLSEINKEKLIEERKEEQEQTSNNLEADVKHEEEINKDENSNNASQYKLNIGQDSYNRNLSFSSNKGHENHFTPTSSASSNPDSIDQHENYSGSNQDYEIKNSSMHAYNSSQFPSKNFTSSPKPYGYDENNQRNSGLYDRNQNNYQPSQGMNIGNTNNVRFPEVDRSILQAQRMPRRTKSDVSHIDQNVYRQGLSYGQNGPGYGQSRHEYGQGGPGYGQFGPGYGQNAPGYGQNGQSGSGYGQDGPGYSQNGPGYGQYGQSKPEYGQNGPVYGQNGPGYGQNGQYGQSGSGYGQNGSGFSQSGPGYDQRGPYGQNFYGYGGPNQGGYQQGEFNRGGQQSEYGYRSGVSGYGFDSRGIAITGPGYQGGPPNGYHYGTSERPDSHAYGQGGSPSGYYSSGYSSGGPNYGSDSHGYGQGGSPSGGYSSGGGQNYGSDSHGYQGGPPSYYSSGRPDHEYRNNGNEQGPQRGYSSGAPDYRPDGYGMNSPGAENRPYVGPTQNSAITGVYSQNGQDGLRYGGGFTTSGPIAPYMYGTAANTEQQRNPYEQQENASALSTSQFNEQHRNPYEQSNSSTSSHQQKRESQVFQSKTEETKAAETTFSVKPSSESNIKKDDDDDDDDENKDGIQEALGLITKNKTLQSIFEWCRRNQDIVNNELKDIRTILMSTISPVLCEKTHFLLAVFGTYKPGKPVIRIEYFVGQFSVYMTKQQPKDVVLKGEDGKFYQYLLKGHEDLRLDERIMQFFHLINSLMNKETCFNGNLIQTICVMPISHSHGLVQWVPGTETLRNIVEEYRSLHHIDPTIEYALANEMSVTNFDYLQPIKKLQIIEMIFKEVPDTDIANSFWLKTNSAELWFKKTNTFAISTAINSIVGYVIGLGDRHPSNLLIDRDSGKVVHIDFGDCFEKAMLRSLLPEVVPFRLTRMIVRAFGAAGLNGIYRSTFVNMSNLLRENARVLVMVLSVFVHEPLAVPDDAGTSIATSETLTDHINISSSIEKLKASEKFNDVNLLTSSELISSNLINPENNNDRNIDERVVSPVEMRKRVMQKLTGNDFGEEKKMSVEDQATKLIKLATDTYNLSKMYSGWCPFW